MAHVDDPRLDQPGTDADALSEAAEESVWQDERLIRALNVTAATIGLIVTLPLWLLIGLAIRLRRRNVPPAEWETPDR